MNSGIRFEWDRNKARANLDKHGISFEEASTAFGERWSLYTPMTMKRSGSSARASPRRGNASNKRKAPKSAAEYEFRGGVRGKYAERYSVGTNVVRLDADVARAFPTSRAVNKALRTLLTDRHP